MDNASQDNDSATIEMMDRAQRRLLKEQARAEAEALQKKTTQDQEGVALLKKRALAEKKAKKKKNTRIMIGIGGGLIVLLIGVAVFAPRKISLSFDICDTFLQNTLRFPRELRLSNVEDFGTYIRIWYTQVDAFGAYRMENIQCTFKEDSWEFAKITINRRPVDPRVVARFNLVIPLLVENPPNLSPPPPVPDNLADLKFDPDSLRGSLF